MPTVDPKIVIALLVAILAGGCACPTPQVVVKTEHVLVVPSPELTQPCTVTAPPDKETYINSSSADKEKMLFLLSSDLYSNLKECNNHWANLNQWYTDQGKIYNK